MHEWNEEKLATHGWAPRCNPLLLQQPCLCKASACGTSLQQEDKAPLPPTEGSREATHQDTSTLHRYKYISPHTHTHSHIHTKSQAHHRDGGCGKRLRAWNRCPPAPPEPGHASAMPGCPGLPLGALIHCFHLLPGKWRAEMSKCMGITPLSLTLSVSVSLAPCPSTLPLNACHLRCIHLPIRCERKIVHYWNNTMSDSSLQAITPTKQSLQLSADRPVLYI